ncbi:SAM-dependent methyltransferase [Ancylobacter pratisalsi]|uniref:Class I SAM-dependent methyltransferase n=1 Tax=Ancylobacter pratisalsi TaxID=1745854 RepID=A0A6P1YP83_9HYPH|nr:cyclopropane-fatty-acyl-phospholipid synthase family protein [Ancylobacter pratisalsi]QIB33554.1 class I SAM-dependent methyltransferase [Ancylobacter pratisalsi]
MKTAPLHTDADTFDGQPRTVTHPPGRANLREMMLARLLDRLAIGGLTVVTPEGRRLTAHGPVLGPEAVVVLHRWRALRRLLTGGDVALSDAYVAGDWSSPDLAAFIELAAHHVPRIAARIDALPPVRLWNRLRHALRSNSRSGSRRNISFHYDLGNSFYEAWLDPGMSYSSALYAREDQSLEEAQQAKLARIIELLDVAPGQRVLEIGCGWGGLAMALARRGADVTGITLSREQLAYGQTMIETSEGLPGRAQLRLQDYRELDERYDRVVSIEMFEAVGENYWSTYFARLRACLVQGGTAVLQVITIAEDRFEGYRRNTDFIQRRIFPGGMLPTKTHIAEHARDAGLELVDTECFGQSYARTLKEWRTRFLNARQQLEPLGFDAEFRRLWEYYLSYCEGGFRSGAIDVGLYRLRG